MVKEHNWTHLRKQTVDPRRVDEWDTFLNEAGIDISAFDVDEFEHFDSGRVKVKTRSKPRREVIFTEEEREDSGRREHAMQRLRDFLGKEAKNHR